MNVKSWNNTELFVHPDSLNLCNLAYEIKDDHARRRYYLYQALLNFANRRCVSYHLLKTAQLATPIFETRGRKIGRLAIDWI